jgi:hypothetical protein
MTISQAAVVAQLFRQSSWLQACCSLSRPDEIARSDEEPFDLVAGAVEIQAMHADNGSVDHLDSGIMALAGASMMRLQTAAKEREKYT